MCSQGCSSRFVLSSKRVLANGAPWSIQARRIPICSSLSFAPVGGMRRFSSKPATR